MSDEISKLNERLQAVESSLSRLQEDNRSATRFLNLWRSPHDPLRRGSAIRTLLSWLVSPGVVAGIGTTFLGAAGLYIAIEANTIISNQNSLIRDQNELFAEQSRTTLEEQQNNLYFQGLQRRTFLLSSIYKEDEVPRTRKEALKEFLRLDRELKIREMRIYSEEFREEGRLVADSAHDDSPHTISWERLVTLHPGLRTDLSGVVLRDMDMQFIDLRYVVLVDADLSCSDLSHAKLQHSDLTKTRFVGTRMEGAKLDHATSTQTDFSGAQLNGASLAHTWLSDANFDMAFLWKTDFSEYRNQDRPPLSAKGAFVGDLYDIDGSGGAKQFEDWARDNGATKQSSYDEWKEEIAQDVESGLLPRLCE